MWQKTMVYLGLKDDDEGYEYDYDELDLAEEEFIEAAPAAAIERPAKIRREPAPRRDVPTPPPAVRVTPRVRALPVEEGEPTVTPMIRPLPSSAARVHVVEPQGFNDAQEVGDRLKSDQPVIINLQGLGRDLQRRLIDFSSGLTYAIGGSMARVSDQVFLLTPSNVEVSQEEKDRLQARGLYGA
ncbi:MAG: cell division protein SepF [Acidimicrobiia bacterium]|nr:cell division protein SepF [Acidimicrobiia bacterium]